MVWSERHKLWMDKDTRSPKRKRKDERIAARHPHSSMPEPIGIYPCRLPDKHKGPCSFKGFFTSDNGVRVCMDVAWTSPWQMREMEMRDRELKRAMRRCGVSDE